MDDPPKPPPLAEANRFGMLDSMRGLAAFSVMLTHFYASTYKYTFLEVLPEWVVVLIDRYLIYGVDVFFVLSGFVMAFVLSRRPIDAPLFGNFLLRRTARIGPPYWATIILALVYWKLSNVVFTWRQVPMPSFPEIAANVFFVQEILSLPHVLGVFWTLCIEMQFYLVFGLLVWAESRFRLLDPSSPRTHGWCAVHLGLVALSLAIHTGWLPLRPAMAPWFITFWYSFAAGAFTFRYLTRSIPRWSYWAMLGLLTAATALTYANSVFVSTGSALFILFAGERGRLGRWLCHPALLYLGAISYSLYLVHSLVGPPVMNLSTRLGDSLAVAVGAFLVAILIAIGVSDLMYRLIERPATRLSHWLKPTPKPSVPPPVIEPIEPVEPPIEYPPAA